MSADLVIRPHRPRRRVVILLLSVSLVAGGGWGLFEYGRYSAGHDAMAAREQRRALQEEVNRLERENRELQGLVTLADRGGQVDREAHEEVRQTLGSLNAEILRLREELAFYQGIVSPRDAQRGLRIHSIRIEATAEPRVHRFRMMLIQAMQHERQVTGNARITVVGTESGATREYPLDELSERFAGGLAFDFRYFQEVEGDILLPEAFTPDRVEVALYTGGDDTPQVERVFDWPTRFQEG